MTNPYAAAATPKRRARLVLAALLLAGASVVQAQTIDYPIGNVISTAGTYTDLGTTGTAVATPNTDDANSGVTPIGFTFNFNGTAFSDFVLNTNGYIKLGSSVPEAPYFSAGAQDVSGGPLNSTTENNLILPFNGDLQAATAGATEYRVATTGTGTSRVCTIQWKNVRDKPRAASAANPATIGTQIDNFSFQLKLYEGSNTVEFVYGSSTAGAGPDVASFFVVGLKGSGTGAGQSLVVTKPSFTPWSGPQFINGTYATGSNGFNVRSVARADAGRTISFGRVQANDAATAFVYTLGKLPVPAAGPHVVRSYIRNVGTNNLTNVAVTLTVSGSNTFTNTQTVPILGVNDSALVTFAPYTPTALGTNTVRVSVGSDNFDANNAKSITQLTTADAITYVDPESAPSGFIYGFNAAAVLASRHRLAQARTVTNVKVNITNDPTRNNGRSVYAVVLDAQGNIAARSADRVLAAGDNGQQVTFTFPTNPTVPAGRFFIGLGLVFPTGATPFFPVDAQLERPLRPDTVHYIFPVSGGTTGGIATAIPSQSDRFRFEATLGTPQSTSSAALDRAIAMYPNPTTGLVTLDIRGAKANEAMQVQVTNLLGQTVHTANVRDNFSNQLNLSGLANGMYLLRIENGREYTIRQLAVTK